MYIGKTVKEPESRWVQHRKMGTGPYKNGADYAEWKIVRGNLPQRKLDYRELYFIGYYNTYQEGYYEQGKNDSRDTIGTSEERA